MPEFEGIVLTRIVASPETISSLRLGTIAMRVAADEVLVIGDHVESIGPIDDGIVEADHGFVVWHLDANALELILREHAEWAPPASQPSMGQGAIAGIPVKCWFDADRSLMLIPRPYRRDAAARLS